MEAHIQKQLLDRAYEKRKLATIELEKQIRSCLAQGDHARINLIVAQLCALLVNTSPNNINARNGGLIGLAGAGIALGQEIAPYLQQIVPPILTCFVDPDSKIRYFACESFYNIAKVCKGEILVYFNEILDALSKLAADSDLSVRNAAELFDRLLKDIVAEAAPHYVSHAQNVEHIRAQQDARDGVAGGAAELDVAREKARFASSHQHLGHFAADREAADRELNKAFSLARFVPLLAERIYVLSPFTRNFLVSWITVLDSVPQLELVSYLPAFLDGLLKYLSDPNTDVRVATANVLADFLKEIKEAAESRNLQLQREQRRHEQEQAQAQAQAQAAEASKRLQSAVAGEASGKLIRPVARRKGLSPTRSSIRSVLSTSTKSGDAIDTAALGTSVGTSKDVEQVDGQPAGDASVTDAGDTTADAASESVVYAKTDVGEEEGQEDEFEEAAVEETIIEEPVVENWEPGFTLRVDHQAIMEILLDHVSYPDEDIQATALHWISQLLTVVQDVIVPFTPRLLPNILPLIAHHSPAIQAAANATNVNLYRVIQQLASPAQPPPSQPPSRPISSATHRDARPVPAPKDRQVSPRIRSGTGGEAEGAPQSPPRAADAEEDHFDYHATVISLTLQLLDEHEETRVCALEWLLMLHAKAPRKILVMDDGTFPALLKTLSDPSEEVIKSDLRLLAQISSLSDDSYFHLFMTSLLSLFSTDRRLLETRGSLIIRQLCSALHTERIFRTLAEILEKEEDLEFASIMVQNLNIILITSPELADFRKRLKNLETRDGSALFVSLYRSWSHNAVATFSLCLLAQAYEHASNLLSIFADLEITVTLLLQIDKLVQLLESPVFTSLRLQLLEPERHPYLFKCLYGLLMLLPQSSAFATLRNRLNAVSSLGFLQTVPRASYAPASSTSGAAATGGAAASTTGTVSTSRSKLGKDSHVQWNELLMYFRSIQLRHERARRSAMLAAQAAERAQTLDKEPFGSLPERLDGLGLSSPIQPSARGKSAFALRSSSMSPIRQIRQSTIWAEPHASVPGGYSIPADRTAGPMSPGLARKPLGGRAPSGRAGAAQ